MQLCYFTNTSQVRHQIKCRFFEVKPWNSEVLVIAVLSFWYIIRSLKQRCFWAMDVNQKWGLFPFDMPWQYHICIAKCLYSYRDYLPENLDKTTIGSLIKHRQRKKRQQWTFPWKDWVENVIHGGKIREFRLWFSIFLTCKPFCFAKSWKTQKRKFHCNSLVLVHEHLYQSIFWCF